MVSKMDLDRVRNIPVPLRVAATVALALAMVIMVTMAFVVELLGEVRQAFHSAWLAGAGELDDGFEIMRAMWK